MTICWNGRIYLSLDEKIEKAAGLDFFGRGLNNGRNINRPENLVFFCGLEEDFMLGKVTDYVPRSILWTFQLVRIFLYYIYIDIYT